MEKAKKQPITRQQIESQMRRTGGTPFVIRKIDMDYPGDLFAPLGALNQLRRDLLDKATQALLEKRRPTGEKVARARDRLKEMRLNCHPALWRSPGKPRSDNSRLCRQPGDGGGCNRGRMPSNLLRAALSRRAKGSRQRDQGKAGGGKGHLPERGHRADLEVAEDHQELIFSRSPGGCSTRSMWTGSWWKILVTSRPSWQARPKARIYGASGLNVWNHLTIQALAPHLQRLTLSPELSRDQLACTVAAASELDSVAEAGADGAGQPGGDGDKGLRSESRQEKTRTRRLLGPAGLQAHLPPTTG